MGRSSAGLRFGGGAARQRQVEEIGSQPEFVRVPEKFSTFEVRTNSVARLAAKALSQAGSQRGLGLLALTTEAAALAPDVAHALAKGEGTWIVTVASGVLSERGEVEGIPAAVGLTLPGVKGAPVLETSSLDQFARDLATATSSGRGALVLSPADGRSGSWLATLRDHLGPREAHLLGAGTPPGQLHYVASAGQVTAGRSVGVAFDRSWLPHVTSSAGCRLLSPLFLVTKARERTLLEFEGLPALAALSQSTAQLDDSPLILMAVAASDEPLSSDGRKLALRAIVGVDPGRGSIDVTDEIPVGARVAFAVRDGHAARADLDAHLRSLRQSCRGGAPAFGVYLCGSGRGRHLYDADDVDVRVIRSHFPDMPLLGFHSVFELSPIDGRLTLQMQSGVLGVFCAPS